MVLATTISTPAAQRRRLRLPLPLVLAYVVVFLLLDWVSYVHPMRGTNITPWNPQAALAVALLVWRPGGWWLVWLALAGAETLVRGQPASWPAEALSSAMLTLGYAAVAAALVRFIGPLPQGATRRSFGLFVLIVAAGAALNALLYVGALALFGMPAPERQGAALLRSWIGEGVSLVVALPLLFTLTRPARRALVAAMLRSRECWLVVLAAVLLALAVFAQSTEDQFKLFYLFFLPVVWAAARFGATGAAWAAALVQGLLIVAVQSARYQPLTVFELHMLLAALAATGLLLGTTVDEREQAERALRATLRLAAAGDMAAALAHELNQPLAALSAYARAAQLLAKRAPDQPAPAMPLAEVLDKLVAEAGRASGVVKRLRDFFRTRSTELRPTELPALLDEVMRSQAERAAGLRVALHWQCDATLPAVWLDRVQIEVVLRNLVANALEAAAGGAASAVQVLATLSAGQVLVTVHDSGPGVPAEALAHLFDTRASTKPGGMGIGLGISRSIVEAHGGRLWAEPGPGGKFVFSLPLSLDALHA
ncbi:MAG: MASE1 domain-containing protein [Burkholderiales bacterium]|nr:MASE1 domain-containing protein [Burkholderiales bacterium]